MLVRAVFDVVEGHDAKAHVAESLGDDPGATAEMWSAAVAAHLKGGGR